jgi:hypothetical protein
MSENEPAAEYEYKEMSGIIKYYHDINTTVRSEDDAFMAIVRLIDGLPVAATPDPQLLIHSEYMPSDWCIENEPRIAKEMLAVLPFCHLGQLVEMSELTAGKVVAWYDDALRGARMIISKDHSIECLRSENGVHYDNCAKSFMCPHRIIETQLTEGMMLPDFNHEMYSDNPNRAYAINTNKLTIGVERGILLPRNAESLKKRYELQYEQWMSSRNEYQTRNKSS